eukprot:760886-Hanusia_phi.AAC.1
MTATERDDDDVRLRAACQPLPFWRGRVKWPELRTTTTASSGSFQSSLDCPSSWCDPPAPSVRMLTQFRSPLRESLASQAAAMADRRERSPPWPTSTSSSLEASDAC